MTLEETTSTADFLDKKVKRLPYLGDAPSRTVSTSNLWLNDQQSPGPSFDHGQITAVVHTSETISVLNISQSPCDLSSTSIPCRAVAINCPQGPTIRPRVRRSVVRSIARTVGHGLQHVRRSFCACIFSKGNYDEDCYEIAVKRVFWTRAS